MKEKQREYTIRSVPCVCFEESTLYRSTLEAKWYAALDYMKMSPWYEPDWARVPKYQIDFFLPPTEFTPPRFIEVKFSKPTLGERRRISNLARQIRAKVTPDAEFWFLIGRPPQDLISYSITRLSKKKAIKTLTNLSDYQTQLLKTLRINRSNPQINKITRAVAYPELTFDKLIDRKHLIQFKPAKHAPKKIKH